MTGPISAKVRRILTGHSDRAFIHAVDDAGLEYKIEVSIEAVRGISIEQGHVLVVSWSLQSTPRVAEKAAEPWKPINMPNSAPSAVDQAFMELMASPRGSPSFTGTNVTNASSGAVARAISQELDEVFGSKTANESRHS